MYDALDTLRNHLSDVAGVKTCAVGVENNITPASYPMVRIEPLRFERSAVPYNNRTAEVLVYFGLHIHQSKKGLPAVYEQLLQMEQDILAVLHRLEVKYVETIFNDEAVNGQFKLAAIRCQVRGI